MAVPSPIPRLQQARTKVRFSRAVIWWISALAVLVAWVVIGYWKASPTQLGRALPRHARYGFVLDGQSPDGNRVAGGVALLRKGVIDTLLVSGTELGSGVYYSMLWVRAAALQGKEKDRVVEVRSGCTSTADEARMMGAFFQQRKVDTVIVVSSAYHLWRAASIFEKVSGSPRWYFLGVPDSRWDGSDREARKAWAMEWAKRVMWVLVESWKSVNTSVAVQIPHLASGEELGRLPVPAWKP